MDNNTINNIMKKSETKIAVCKFSTDNNTYKRKNISKIVATFVLTLGITVGIAYGGNLVYEKVWKEPQKIEGNADITNEEKSTLISENEARKICINYLTKIGLGDYSIREIELSKGLFSNDASWYIGAGLASIRIDAKTGQVASINIPSTNYKIPHNYGITKDEAKKVAHQLLKKYKPINDTNEYTLMFLRGNSEQDTSSYIWYADFYKKYGDLINPSEKISIAWIPTINALYGLEISSIPCDNNTQNISKEEAVKIVTDKDKQLFSSAQIVDTKAEIRIRQMNVNVYIQENYPDYTNPAANCAVKVKENSYVLKDDKVIFDIDKKVRNVWCVVVYHDKSSTNLPYMYTYYVDITTGEIIGGSSYSEFFNEDTLKTDPYNYA